MKHKQKWNKVTRKKIKHVGEQEYINHDTGEIVDMAVTDIEDRDFNFYKVWLLSLMNAIDLVGNKKIKFMFWLVQNLNKENEITMTIRQMAKASKISTVTISRTLKQLYEANFLQKKNIGCYRINPNVIFKGSKTARQNILIRYNAKESTSQNKKISKKTANPKPKKSNNNDNKKVA